MVALFIHLLNGDAIAASGQMVLARAAGKLSSDRHRGTL
jgi:hypothetical protein